MNENGKNGFAWLRVVTPILLTIALFGIGQILLQLTTLGERVYAHQTNSDLHIPRSEFVALEQQLSDMRKEIIATIRREHHDQ